MRDIHYALTSHDASSANGISTTTIRMDNQGSQTLSREADSIDIEEARNNRKTPSPNSVSQIFVQDVSDNEIPSEKVLYDVPNSATYNIPPSTPNNGQCNADVPKFSMCTGTMGGLLPRAFITMLGNTGSKIPRVVIQLQWDPKQK